MIAELYIVISTICFQADPDSSMREWTPNAPGYAEIGGFSKRCLQEVKFVQEKPSDLSEWEQAYRVIPSTECVKFGHHFVKYNTGVVCAVMHAPRFHCDYGITYKCSICGLKRKKVIREEWVEE